MTTFLIILAVYLLSAVALYFVTKFMYLHKHPSTLAPVWAWITPGINTILSLTGLLLCWNYFPITGLEFWKKRWDDNLAPKGLDRVEKELISEWSDKEIESAGFLLSKKKKKDLEDFHDTYHGGLV